MRWQESRDQPNWNWQKTCVSRWSYRGHNKSGVTSLRKRNTLAASARDAGTSPDLLMSSKKSADVPPTVRIYRAGQNVLFRIEINLSHILIVSRAVSHVAILMPTARLAAACAFTSRAIKAKIPALSAESQQAPSAKCLTSLPRPTKHISYKHRRWQP